MRLSKILENDDDSFCCHFCLNYDQFPIHKVVGQLEFLTLMYIGFVKLFYCFLVRYIQTSHTVSTAHILHASQVIPSQGLMEADSNTSESDVILPLPAPSDSSEPVRQMTLGETLKLDELGPIIINTGEKFELKHIYLLPNFLIISLCLCMV